MVWSNQAETLQMGAPHKGICREAGLWQRGEEERADCGNRWVNAGGGWSGVLAVLRLAEELVLLFLSGLRKIGLFFSLCVGF